MKVYRELTVRKRSHRLTVQSDRAVRYVPQEGLLGITGQMPRAARPARNAAHPGHELRENRKSLGGFARKPMA